MPRSHSSPLAWYDGDEVPRAGVASTQALARRQRLYRAWVWASVVLAPFAFLVALVSATRSGAPPAILTSPLGQAAASVALSAWLKSHPAPLPGAHVVDWAGASVVGQAPGPAGWQAVDEHFVLVGMSGTLWMATVEVAFAAGAMPGVVAGPYVVPLATSQSVATSGPWPGLQAGTVPTLVSAAIAGWARAYCSGNPAELRLAVGDNDPAHVYQPLGGVVAEAVAVPWYAQLPRSSDAVAQVDLHVRWAGQRVMPAQPMVMDLLIARASGLAPLVVSWGPPGSGPSLRAYQPQ